jgi:hypothetical protein
MTIYFNRFREDMFLTWNRSEDQLRLLFNVPTAINQQHRPIPLIPSIGTMFHFLDVEVSHDHGVLHTKMYHDPVMDQYELPNKFEYGTLQPSILLQAILMHVVRCCSDEESFHYERRYLKLLYLIYGFSLHFIDDCIQEFYKQFHASVVHYMVERVPYETLRHRVIKHHQQLLVLRHKWRTEIENTQPIIYPNYAKPRIMDYFKCHFFDLLKRCFTFEPEFNENKIDVEPEFVNDIPLSMNNYHKKQKPSHHLLTIPDSESNGIYTSMTFYSFLFG